ncbi:MAG: hypothetical protein LBG11_10610 [Bifidobacteriaceae bacterium]|nr:hypothetical protein [Bifidobacteriaceae bacterium]
MKTGVSLPDDLFGQVTACAREQGVTRSAWIARAAAEQVRRQQEDQVTEAVNRAVAAESPASRAERESIAAEARGRMESLAEGEDW